MEVKYFQDGTYQCCVLPDFQNLQESPAGFGETPEEAYQDLLQQIECEKCQGTGRATYLSSWAVDRGTKYHRSFEQEVTDTCDHCEGSGRNE